MKTSINFLGLVALSFTSVNATNEFKSQDLDQQEFATLTSVERNSVSQLGNANPESEITVLRNTADTAIFSPNSVMKAAYVKTTEEVIAENKLITESKEEADQPLSIDFALENRIAEDTQIIENTNLNVTYPLDFEKINRNVKATKVNNNAIITADLKL